MLHGLPSVLHLVLFYLLYVFIMGTYTAYMICFSLREMVGCRSKYLEDLPQQVPNMWGPPSFDL